MELLPSDSLAPYVGILIWRQNFAGREVFVIEHGEQVVLPKGPLESEEGEATKRPNVLDHCETADLEQRKDG